MSAGHEAVQRGTDGLPAPAAHHISHGISLGSAAGAKVAAASWAGYRRRPIPLVRGKGQKMFLFVRLMPRAIATRVSCERRTSSTSYPTADQEGSEISRSRPKWGVRRIELLDSGTKLLARGVPGPWWRYDPILTAKDIAGRYRWCFTGWGASVEDSHVL